MQKFTDNISFIYTPKNAVLIVSLRPFGQLDKSLYKQSNDYSENSGTRLKKTLTSKHLQLFSEAAKTKGPITKLHERQTLQNIQSDVTYT